MPFQTTTSNLSTYYDGNYEPPYLPSYIGGELLESFSWNRRKDYDRHSYEFMQNMNDISDKLLTRAQMMDTTIGSKHFMAGRHLHDLVNEYEMVGHVDWDDLPDSGRYEYEQWAGQFLSLMGFNVPIEQEEELPITVSKFDPLHSRPAHSYGEQRYREGRT